MKEIEPHIKIRKIIRLCLGAMNAGPIGGLEINFSDFEFLRKEGGKIIEQNYKYNGHYLHRLEFRGKKFKTSTDEPYDFNLG